MAYDEKVARRVRAAVARHGKAVEKKMFGGLAFMLRGHMCCGVLGADLMVRVGPDQYAAALRAPHARVMDFTGRPLKGFVYVAPEGFKTPKALAAWVGQGTRFVKSLLAGRGRQKQARRL